MVTKHKKRSGKRPVSKGFSGALADTRRITAATDCTSRSCPDVPYSRPDEKEELLIPSGRKPESRLPVPGL